MMTCMLKRALPFMMTLIVGTGVGSIFGFHSEPTNSSSPPRFMSAHHDGGGDYRHKCSGNSTELNITYEPNTSYTAEALRNETTGVVTLRVRFGADGEATVLERLNTLPNGLTEEAERVLERTQFTPATIDGQPVSVEKDMNYIFTLSNRPMTGR